MIRATSKRKKSRFLITCQGSDIFMDIALLWQISFINELFPNIFYFCIFYCHLFISFVFCLFSCFSFYTLTHTSLLFFLLFSMLFFLPLFLHIPFTIPFPFSLSCTPLSLFSSPFLSPLDFPPSSLIWYAIFLKGNKKTKFMFLWNTFLKN